jgi:hypothetical protein
MEPHRRKSATLLEDHLLWEEGKPWENRPLQGLLSTPTKKTLPVLAALLSAANLLIAQPHNPPNNSAQNPLTTSTNNIVKTPANPQKETPTAKFEDLSDILKTLPSAEIPNRTHKNTTELILQSAPKAPSPEDWQGEPIFPEAKQGKTPFKEMNPYKRLMKEAMKRKENSTFTLIPQDALAFQLENAGGAKLIEKIAQNYEKDKDSLPFTLQYKEALETPATIHFDKSSNRSRYLHEEKTLLIGIQNQKIDYEKIWDSLPKSRPDLTAKKSLELNGFNETTLAQDWVIGHELRHRWQVDPENPMNPSQLREKQEYGKTEKPYQVAIGEELKQGIGSFLTMLRSRTGRPFLDPKEIRQAVKELEESPRLQKALPAEPMRLFNTLQYLKKTDPKTAEQLLNALCSYGKYLVSAPQPQEFSIPQPQHLTNPTQTNEAQMC